MKRLIVRMSALATVLLLGWIAIAQAQRGSNDSSENAIPSVAMPTASSDQASQQPVLRSANGSAAPRELPGSADANPLRGVASSSKSTAQTPTSATRSERSRAIAALAGSPPGGQSDAGRRPDPFGLRAKTAGQTAGLEGDAPGSTDQPPSNAIVGNQQPIVPGGGTSVGVVAGRGLESVPETGSGEPARLQPEPLRAANPSALAATGANALSSPATHDDLKVAADQQQIGHVAEDNLPGQGTGKPGGKQLEGVQTPQLSIQKFAPEEIQVGKPAVFQVKVQNTGTVSAVGVEIRDPIPKGTRLIDTEPRATRGTKGELVWTLGTMRPGDEVTVESRLMPTEEGEIGSVATVHFRADASARTIATKPQLVIETSASSQVLIGEEVALSITISNPGSGMATGVVLTEHVPPGLRHEAGTELEYEVGNLAPKESRQLNLILVAARPGPVKNLLTARGDANLKAQDQLDLEVIAPQLDIAVAGPKRRYLEREATYQVMINNPGSAPARQVELVAHLPSGLKFLNANNAGHYEAETRTVHWMLEELPTKESGTVELTAMPVEAGQQKIRVRGTAEQGLSVEKEQPVLIEGIAAILFEVVDVDDPIEAGGETTYEIRVLNQGSKAATNVRVAALLPTDMRPTAAEGPTKHVIDANRVLFEGLSRLAPKADTTYRVRVQGLQPGDQRIRVQLLTDQIRTPVTKEESTRVYSDE